MNHQHILLALFMAIVWGSTFSIMKIGLQGNSALVFSALRSVVVLPLLLFIPRPKLPWKIILLIGFLIGVCKLPFMLLAIYLGLPAGITSLLSQSQVLFTILLAIAVFHEVPRLQNWIGMGVAFIGITLIAVNVEHASIPLSALCVVFLSAISWAFSNIITRKYREVNMVHLTVWMNVVPPIPLLLIAGLCEGWEVVAYPITHFSWVTTGAIVYAGFLSGIFGYSCWGYLLKHYPASLVAPFSLLVPVFSLTIANILLGEELTFVSLIGAMCVLIGLGINHFRFDRRPSLP